MTAAVNWVFLRGLTREARHWSGFTAQFEARLAPSRVTTLDLPGNGEFHAQTSPLRVESIVVFARQQLLAQGIKPPYALLAMSLGGMVATNWAQRYPDEISHLVLITTSMRPASIMQRLRPGNWLALLALAWRWDDRQYAERSIHRITCNQTAQRDADLTARFACAPQTPRCATLVLASRGDRLVSPLCSTRLAAAWQVRQQVHPWAGHDLPHDDGPWVCERVADWLMLLDK